MHLPNMRNLGGGGGGGGDGREAQAQLRAFIAQMEREQGQQQHQVLYDSPRWTVLVYLNATFICLVTIVFLIGYMCDACTSPHGNMINLPARCAARAARAQSDGRLPRVAAAVDELCRGGRCGGARARARPL